MNSPHSYTTQDRDAAIERLHGFVARKEFVKFRDQVLDDLWMGAPDDVTDGAINEAIQSYHAQMAYFGFLLFDAPRKSGRTLVETFLIRHAKTISSGERAYLELASKSHIRLYEVADIQLDEGVTVHDLFDDAEQFVWERKATQHLARGMIMAARVIDGPEGKPTFDAIAGVFPPDAKLLLVDLLRVAKKEAEQEGVTDPGQFFKGLVPAIHRAWMHVVAFPVEPDLRPPVERLTELLAERDQKERELILSDIMHDAEKDGTVDAWVKAVRALESEKVMSADLASFLVIRFVERTMVQQTQTDGELRRLGDAMEAVERAHGLSEDDAWYVNEGPDEWRALNAEWDVRHDAVIVETLRRVGETALAEAAARDYDDYEMLTEAGRREFFGEPDKSRRARKPAGRR